LAGSSARAGRCATCPPAATVLLPVQVLVITLEWGPRVTRGAHLSFTIAYIWPATAVTFLIVLGVTVFRSSRLRIEVVCLVTVLGMLLLNALCGVLFARLISALFAAA
jgi:hypothetical protein